MFITIKSKNKKIKVDVSEKNCPLYTCFSPHQHRNYYFIEKYRNDYSYCDRRNHHGCPVNKEKMEEKL